MLTLAIIGLDDRRDSEAGGQGSNLGARRMAKDAQAQRQTNFSIRTGLAAVSADTFFIIGLLRANSRLSEGPLLSRVQT